MDMSKSAIMKRAKELARRNNRIEKERAGKPPKPPVIPPVNADELNQAIAAAAAEKMGYSINTRQPIGENARIIAQRVVAAMDCPLISKEWNCNKTEDGKKLTHPIYTKGEEPQCINGNFMNCPAYRLYFNFVVARHAKKK